MHGIACYESENPQLFEWDNGTRIHSADSMIIDHLNGCHLWAVSSLKLSYSLTYVICDTDSPCDQAVNILLIEPNA